MAYDWDDKQQDCYRLYVEEGMSLEKVMDWFKSERGFAPSRRAFQVQFKKWNFPSKQHPLEDDEVLTARVKELWEANIGQKDMLRMLNDEGFAVKERELMRLRGKKRWLLRSANGEGLTINESPVESHSPQKSKRGRQSGRQTPKALTELDLAALEKRQGILEKRQVESDERWEERKRRRRTRGWAGLPADPEGPPRFPSETTLDESKVMLQMDNDVYRKVRDQFHKICEEFDILKKTSAGPEKWQQAKNKLIRENEHLQRVLHYDEAIKLEQKLLSLDVVCLDVTKRMRVMQTRVTIADAKNVLCINPEESRKLRATFFAKLKDENFTNKTDLGQQRWDQLKEEWIAESPLLQRILDPDDQQYQTKLKAVEMLCRDVMKRLRDDLARRDPNRQKQSKGPGPGPAPPRHPVAKIVRNKALRVPASSRVRSTEQADAGLFASADLQIDPSLLLAASDALPHMLDNEANQGYLDSLPQQPLSSPDTTYAAQQASSMGIWMRLHPHSLWQAEPKLWLGAMTSGTLNEVRQQISNTHPEAQIVRIAGIVKDTSTGADIGYSIDDDAKLSGYLAHVSAGDALFEVSLIPSAK